mmetsp:Transcript_33743/g.53648  ORF Transcript_33743/g.53648 Transcript_33743/m.53648 type:complete len:183 (-) Transcript_33743:302-850(-)|eukprot:CAMPEP_0169077514 /NCGR_PEP_ID=MMETSP1015-20121227/8919_1 /TAXON_ID=342587 /ORGANISM="Karlodinium micrum, Strain CCMP2283" /LENGTH=182 /DNA_ID=CAMNT_0009137043 /DNA_START=26 /DNA_END=574 /DNA_ORIENTATION=-
MTNFAEDTLLALNVESVSLPANGIELADEDKIFNVDGIEVREGHCYFGVDVMPSDGCLPYRVMRRYRDFCELAERLGADSRAFPDAPFPKKHHFGLTGKQLQKRRADLESWLNRTLEHADGQAAWLRPLSKFLCVNDQTRQLQKLLSEQLQNAALIPSSCQLDCGCAEKKNESKLLVEITLA